MNVIGVKFDKSYQSDELLKKIDEYKDKNDMFIQIFNHRKVVGEEHLMWAYKKAKESIEQNSNRADSLEIETLLWASAEWQIKHAIEKMGVSDGSKNAVLMIENNLEDFLNHMDWKKYDKIKKPSIEKLKSFGIQQKEIDSVSNPYDLIFEKMSTSIL